MDASRLVVALGWALVHSFWMLALVGLAFDVAGLHALLPHRHRPASYWAWPRRC